MQQVTRQGVEGVAQAGKDTVDGTRPLHIYFYFYFYFIIFNYFNLVTELISYWLIFLTHAVYRHITAGHERVR
jgi:hypothetical protein